MDAADQAAPAAVAQQRQDALVGSPAQAFQGVDFGASKKLWVLAERLGVFADIGTDRCDPRRHFDRLRAGMGVGNGSAERIGQCFVDFAGEMIEGAPLVEAAHLDRPFHRRAFAANRQLAVSFAGDGDDAAIDFRRVGCVDRKLGLAGQFALSERRVVEKRKAHRTFDLERALAGEEHRRRVGIDALRLLAAVGRGVGEKGQHFVLGARLLVQAAAPILLISTIARPQTRFPAFPNMRY